MNMLKDTPVPSSWDDVQKFINSTQCVVNKADKSKSPEDFMKDKKAQKDLTDCMNDANSTNPDDVIIGLSVGCGVLGLALIVLIVYMMSNKKKK